MAVFTYWFDRYGSSGRGVIWRWQCPFNSSSVPPLLLYLPGFCVFSNQSKSQLILVYNDPTEPWRCTEREKTPAPSAVCTHPTPGSTIQSGRLQHPPQLHTGCRNSLGKTPGGLSLDAQFEVKCHPTSCLSGTKEIWTICSEVDMSQTPTADKSHLDSPWTGRNGKLWHENTPQQMVLSDVLPMYMQVKFGRTKWEILFGLQGTSSAPWQSEKGMKFQGIARPGGAWRAGTATLEKHLFAIKFGLQKAFSHLARSK